MELSGMRHTDDPYKTNQNILTYNKIDVWSSTVLCDDNTRHTFKYPDEYTFSKFKNIARIMHHFYFYPEDVDAWIAIDFHTGDIKITGNKISNILSLFDNPQQKTTSLDELIDNFKQESINEHKQSLEKNRGYGR